MRIRASIVALGVLCVALPAAGDMLITKKVATGAIALLAQDGRETEHRVWFGDGKLSDISADGSTIVDLTQQRLFLVDHKAQTFSAIELPLDMEAIMPAEAKPMIEAMVKGISVEVTPTEETRTINEFPTKKYAIKVSTAMGMQILIDSWVTRESPIDVTEWKKLSTQLTALSPVMAEAMEAMDAVDGFPILQEVTVVMMGTEVKSTEEVLTVESKKAPEGTYGPPEGYAELPFNPAALLGGG